jgi:5'-3' exonuclease
MNHVHLVDGTYELYRHYFAVPPRKDEMGIEIGAMRGVISSMVALLRGGATHVGVATDHVIESFRNDLYDGYKKGEGVEPDLLVQFHPLEEALRELGLVVWAMDEYEADDAMASAVSRVLGDKRTGRVHICSPDKDLAQCVSARRVVMLDRRRDVMMDEDGVRAKFGVSPWSIPDYLALVGDSADGYPGVPRWGAKSTATVLSRYRFLEDIPKDHERWTVKVRGAASLAASLVEHWGEALLFRDLSTLRTDALPSFSLDELEWKRPRHGFAALCEQLGIPRVAAQVEVLSRQRADERAER